eukprot:TRINITY_DN3609_c0_g1_i1.p1 TRINITY_DN3609_c0_g1~~TRINITY_DN3609_c0_g1_i1.p1  ORF type:complete len:367 (-),score=90.62 TRINITY_DN3609_c0_g1_i1:69-1169(-)
MSAPATCQDESIQDSSYHTQSGSHEMGWKISHTILGHGGFSRVYLAHHSTTATPVAAKVIKSTQNCLLEDEINVLCELRGHPHICQLLDIAVSNTHVVLFQEYYERGVYEALEEAGQFSEGVSRQLFRQLISAVSFMHDNGIVHRDLKLQNLMLSSDGSLKVIDMGLSCKFDMVKQLERPCGSINYASPEILKGKKYWGPEVDIWSCGVLLFNFLTGKAPFVDSRAAIKLRGKYHYPAILAKGSKKLVQKMLKLNPKKRATIEQIQESQWLQEDTKPQSKEFKLNHTLDSIFGRWDCCTCSPCFERDSIPSDGYTEIMTTLDEMAAMGFERESLIHAISQDKVAPSFPIATLMLLLAQKRRESTKK